LRGGLRKTFQINRHGMGVSIGEVSQAVVHDAVRKKPHQLQRVLNFCSALRLRR
jgi:hypothetical protein